MSQWWQILTRRKELDSQQMKSTELGRVLNVFDLTLLGVGSTLGVGVYVLAGHVARDTAGPSVIISFLIAAVASVFAGLCYAEFGARVPKAGSAYIYSYVSVGELVAFIIGWNLILEYMIGSASVARAFTLYLDNLLGYKINSTFTEIAPIGVEFMSPYFDFLSFGITVLLGVAMAFGLKESKWANNVFTILNIAVVIFVIAAGAYFGDIKNWQLTNTPDGVGGFKPYGIEGIFKGAATCFYGFVGFDCIATTGEEVKNPKKAIPISIIVSLFVIFLAYFGTSAVVTLMWPYYDLDPNSPIPDAFEKNDFPIGKWIVAIGGMFGLAASLFGAMFPLPRIIYAMAEDSLIFRFLGHVNKKFKTPVVGTVVAAILTGLMAALFDLKQLVNMMSIGTLLAYTIVATCVLLLRYSLDEEDIADIKYSAVRDSDSSDYEYNDQPLDDGEHSNLLASKRKTARAVVKQMFNLKKKTPNHLTRKIVNVQIVFFCVLALLFAACMKWLIREMIDLQIWALAVTSAVVFFMLLTLCSISAQPVSPTKLTFKVPFVPLLPALSICFNVYLMLMLDYYTWIRFGVWMAIGLPVYLISACLYHKQKLTKPRRKSLSEFSIQNGIVNYSYVDVETVQESTTLTIIPEIVVQPATPQILSDEPEKNKVSLRKKYSIFERPNTETELYKNFNMTSADSTPVTLRRVSRSREQSLRGGADTDTESESSREHHIQADVHREDDAEERDDSDGPSEQSIENSHEHERDRSEFSGGDDRSESSGSAASHDEAINMLNRMIELAESSHPRMKNASTMSLCSFQIEDPEDVVEVRSPRISNVSGKAELETISLHENETESQEVNEAEETSRDEAEDVPTEEFSRISADVSDENKSPVTDIEPEEESEQNFVPPPPPPLPPSDNYFKFVPPIVAIRPADRPNTLPVTASQIQNVALKKTASVPKRKNSEMQLDLNGTVKAGTKEMEQIKHRLNDFYKDYKPPRTPVYKTQLSEVKSPASETPPTPIKPPTPEIITTTEEYAKSHDFKEKLGSLLFNNSFRNQQKRPGSIASRPTEAIPTIPDEENKNVAGDVENISAEVENNSSEDDAVKSHSNGEDGDEKSAVKIPEKYNESLAEHKKKMMGTLRSIKLRKTGLIDFGSPNEDESDQVVQDVAKPEDVDKNQNIKTDERDRQEHRKKMIATLRSIKLRKTGILDIDENGKALNFRDDASADIIT